MKDDKAKPMPKNPRKKAEGGVDQNRNTEPRKPGEMDAPRIPDEVKKNFEST